METLIGDMRIHDSGNEELILTKMLAENERTIKQAFDEKDLVCEMVEKFNANINRFPAFIIILLCGYRNRICMNGREYAREDAFSIPIGNIILAEMKQMGMSHFIHEINFSS